jgi:hypothetical protein
MYRAWEDLFYFPNICKREMSLIVYERVWKAISFRSYANSAVFIVVASISHPVSPLDKRVER